MSSNDAFVIQLLIDKNLIDSTEVESTRSQLKEAGSEGDEDTAVLEALEARSVVSQKQITDLLAEEFNMETVDLSDVRVSEEALATIPYDLASRYKVIPLEADESEIELAIADPLDMDAIDSISHVVRRSVNCHLAPLRSIEKAILEYYKEARGSEVDEIFSEVLDLDSLSAPQEEASDTENAIEDEAPIIRYVHRTISEALRQRASDIHLEPLEKRFRIRYRIDGVLHEMESPPKRLQPSIISRIKLMADISIAEKRVPQDGRINIKVNAKVIDLRVSTMPTAFGESIVMRILDKESLHLGLPELGFFSDDQAVFERTISLPDGVFLVTGPTGSGKSTTLYSALNYINHPDRKIITVEDPVEYEMSGVNQVQVRREVGMTFASALRSMLRQAPNIIMVGEIRDKETAEITINAALTGHMVFSTLHTNDAPSAISRLIHIGIKPFLIAAAVRAVLAQRLVRRNCPGCREHCDHDEKLLHSLGIYRDKLAEASFMKGKGCNKCNGTGFHGRVGIFEVFSINQELQQMIYEEASLVDIRNKARSLGLRNMREDGIRKVIAGVTTPDEVLHATVTDRAE